MKYYYLLPCAIIGLVGASGCLTDQIIDHELDVIYTVEFYTSPTTTNGLFVSNNSFPCLEFNNCSPSILTAESVQFKTGGLLLDIRQEPNRTYHLSLEDRDVDAGDTVILSGQLSEDFSFEIKEVMPADLEGIVLGHDYRLDTPNAGMYLRLDTLVLRESNGLYVLLVTDTTLAPRFGFLIPSDPDINVVIPNNGRFAQGDPSIYFIPQRLIEQSGIFIGEGRQYFASVRHVTPGSFDFYLSYKSFLSDNSSGLESGLLFAPPDQLPTNVDLSYPGFGYYHVYQESIVSGPID